MNYLANKCLTICIIITINIYGFASSNVHSADVSVLSDSIKQRSLVGMGDLARLDTVFAKARRGEPITLAALGGSITAGGIKTKDPTNRYISQVARWFQTKFPNAKVTFINAGIGSTNSGYGALRVQRDVLSKQPDFVIVEYAVNDSFPGYVLDDSYEGVLRQILSSPREPAVVELFFNHQDGNSAQKEQVRLGNYYDLPMVSFRDAFYPEYKAGVLKWEDYYADVVHPNDAGHLFATELLSNFLDKALAAMPANDADLPKIKSLPAPLVSDSFERCWLFRSDELKPVTNAAWTMAADHSLQCQPTGGKLEFETPGGDRILLGATIPKEAKDKVFVSVDGGTRTVVDVKGPNRALVVGLNPTLVHHVLITVDPYTPSADDKNPNVGIFWGGAAGLPKKS